MKRSHIAMALSLAALVAAGCRQSGEHTILPPDVALRAGDIVFRRGIGIESRAVYAADNSGEYSHVGIVALLDGEPVVVHAVPGEPDYDGDPDRVKADSPETFFTSSRAQKGAVCRVADSAAAAEAAAYALRKYSEGVLFDDNYDDSDTTRLYCCELVVNAYRHAGISLVGSGRHHIHIPGFVKTDCILPSDIHNNNSVSVVYTFINQ